MGIFAKKSTLLVLLCTLVLVTVFFLPACSKKQPESKEIKIGHISPLTGDDAIWGKWESDGINLAVDEINSKGGIAGAKLTIIHEDDRDDPKLSVAALQKLITINEVKIVIGATTSSPTLACAPVAEKNKFILFSPSAQSPKISQAGDYIFRIFPINTDEAKNLAVLAESFKIQNTAILYLNNDYGLGIRDVLHQLLPEKKIAITAEEKYDGDTKDFRTQITKIKDSSPQAVFLLGYPPDMALILLQMKELGLKAQIFAPNAFEGEEVIKIAKDATEGVIYVYPTIPDSEKSKEVKKIFQNKYGYEMNVYNAMGYDAVRLLKIAIEQTIKEKEELDTSRVKDCLYKIKEFQGVTGLITIDKNGDAIDRPMEAQIIHNGRHEVWNQEKKL